jgi:hypothetical protein
MADRPRLFGGIDMIINNSESQVPEIIDLFPQTESEKGNRPGQQKQRSLKRKLSEVILGNRPYLNVYSDVLQTNFWFVNEGLVDPAERMFAEKVITMEMLAEIMAANQPILRVVEELFKEKV